jgi:hypothetical protein
MVVPMNDCYWDSLWLWHDCEMSIRCVFNNLKSLDIEKTLPKFK